MPKVIEVNNVDELDHYRLAWNSLLPETKQATYFQSFDWVTTCLRHFGGHQRLRVLLVYHNAEPIGILPLVVVNERTRIGRIRTLTYPLAEWGSFFGPIGPNPTATLMASFDHLQQTRRDYDMLDLRWIDRARVDHGRTSSAMNNAGLACHEKPWKETSVLDTSTSWDEYFRSRTSKFRNNVRRAFKRVAELGDVTLERFRPSGYAYGATDPRWDLYDTCVDLARRSWQGSSATGTTLSHPHVRDFLREMHGLAARAGTVDLNLLRIDGEPVAFGYNYVYQRRIFALRAGVHPQYADQSVGTVLYAKMFEDSCERDDELIDLGPGSMQSKKAWRTATVTSFRSTHYPLLAPRTQLLRLKHWMSASTSQAKATPAGSDGV